MSVFVPIPHCFDCCNFVILSEVWASYASCFVLFPQNGFGNSESFINSVTQSYLTLCNPMDCSTPGFHVHHQLPKFAQTYVHQVGDATQPPHPLLLLLPSIFPSIRVFSNESSLHIRWPKYWSFSIHSSNEYSG